MLLIRQILFFIVFFAFSTAKAHKPLLAPKSEVYSLSAVSEFKLVKVFYQSTNDKTKVIKLKRKRKPRLIEVAFQFSTSVIKKLVIYPDPPDDKTFNHLILFFFYANGDRGPPSVNNI